MTITVVEDVIEGSSFALTPAGPIATRMFVATCDAGETKQDVLAATGIPVYLEQHPYTGGVGEYAAIYARTITCTHISGERGVFSVQVEYSAPEFLQTDPEVLDPDDCTIQVGASVSAERTSKDKDGVQISVALTDQPTQVGDVEIQVPQTVITFERLESESPLTKASTYAGKVNSVDVGSFTARTLLCLGIEGISVDGGYKWNVSYRFQYNPNTWDATCIYIDPETDRPHADIDIATLDGVTIATIYQEVSFSGLDLPW